MSDDAWEEIQAVKSKRNELRERLQKRRKEREDLLGGATDLASSSLPSSQKSDVKITDDQSEAEPSLPLLASLAATPIVAVSSSIGKSNKEVEDCVLRILTDVALSFPISSGVIGRSLSAQISHPVSQTVVDNLLQKFAAQELIQLVENVQDGKAVLTVTYAEHVRLMAMVNEDPLASSPSSLLKRKKHDSAEELPSSGQMDDHSFKLKKDKKDPKNDDVMSLLSLPSTREKENKKMGEEILDLLSKPTVKEKSLAERFRSQGGAQVKEFCVHGTKEECRRVWASSSDKSQSWTCHRLHFRKIIQPHTDESLGDCSFLNTCFHMETCKYVHYEVDQQQQLQSASSSALVPVSGSSSMISAPSTSVVGTRSDETTILYPPQWIQCDLRSLDMSILGKFSVIMADPPWDIHMELPYGTLSDDEMRQLNIPVLQDEGLIFLWVTGRAMELGRECLQLWGYERVDEIIWVKTNQLQRIIRTGRTGHWLNHGKEHCLVGMKGGNMGQNNTNGGGGDRPPRTLNRGLDCDVIVAEVRATSHKPDEMYGIIERLSPGTRKIELFGRPHNVQPNWITLGNQLDGVHLLDPDLVCAYQKLYPESVININKSVQ